jgi:PIN domain nuclease of toxin-antitoxin system
MNYLLDTHTFLWYINDDPQLSKKAVKRISDQDPIKYVSIAS